MKRPSLSLILPTYNEKDNIIILIKKIESIIHPKEILVIDDHSPDRTGQIVNNYAKTHPYVRTIINNPPLGLTKSLQTGIDKASGKYIAWMDADFSHPPQILPQMLEVIKSTDIVVGSWLIPGGTDKRKEWDQKIFSRIMNLLCQLWFGTFVHAYTSGYIFTKKDLLKQFRLRGNYGEYCIDFLVRNHRAGKTIVEVPFTCVSRRFGETKTAPNLRKFLSNGLRYIQMLFFLTKKI